MFAISTSKATQVSTNSLSASKMALEAQQYAAAEGDVIRMKAYTDLASSAKAPIEGTHFSKEVSLGTESNYTDTIKKRIATVKIYKDSDSFPCYSLDVPRLSAEVSGKGVPIGTVIAWFGNQVPTTNGIWLECNGQSCANYPELAKVLGSNTIPDCRNRFLQSDSIPGKYIEAGLPNITGSTDLYGHSTSTGHTGFVTVKKTGSNHNPLGSTDSEYYIFFHHIAFDASLCSKIYGNSTTVQPPAITVRYFIRAA